MQDDSVGVVTALSPATVGHFKFYLLSSIVGLGLTLNPYWLSKRKDPYLCPASRSRQIFKTYGVTARCAEGHLAKLRRELEGRSV